MNFIILVLKISLVGLWGLAFLGLLSMSPLPTEYQFYVLALAGVVLLAHFLEYFVMKGKVMAKVSIKISFIQTMLWGFGHWLPLLKNKI